MKLALLYIYIYIEFCLYVHALSLYSIYPIQHYPDGVSYVTSLLWHQCLCKSVQYVAWQARFYELHFAHICVTLLHVPGVHMCQFIWKEMMANEKIRYYTISVMCFSWCLWRVGRGRKPWERSEAGGVNDNERHLRHSPVSSPTEELRKE